MRHFLTVDQEGCLLEEGFLQMYSLQTVTDPKETWHDLQQLGYSKEDLDLHPVDHSSEEEDDRTSMTSSRQNIANKPLDTPDHPIIIENVKSRSDIYKPPSSDDH